MAKKSKIAKNEQRQKKVLLHQLKRKELKKIMMDKNIKIAARYEAQVKMMKLPRDSASVRVRNRCFKTGRPRGYYRDFGLCRNVIRESYSFGLLPGVIKSSW